MIQGNNMRLVGMLTDEAAGCKEEGRNKKVGEYYSHQPTANQLRKFTELQHSDFTCPIEQ